MNKINIIHVSVDDFKCLYINDKLIDQNYELNWSDLMNDLVGKEVVSYKSIYIPNCELKEWNGRFPKDFNELNNIYKLIKI